ncbi:MAG: type II toxin-antitoxin system RelE/ParE family toxin [Blastocatellia bacterium]|nr:type II toxin-antitoxin system RelE/ParE family toxin [Blastocatellia bacterium]
MNQYKVYVTPRAFKEIKNLPGNIRQRVRQAIRELATEPRPSQSKALNVPELDWELRRLRLDTWRIVYAVTEDENTVDVLAVRKRPPYDYGDLETLLAQIN